VDLSACASVSRLDDSSGRSEESLKTPTRVSRSDGRQLGGIARLSESSTVLRIVDAADGGSSVCEHGRAAVDSESITPPGGATDSIRCGMEMAAAAKFCSECGTPVAQATPSAEYKQVTILFADVVHSMDIAAALGAERLREIMGELVRRSAAVVQRYNGTVDKFTGDGIMAVFGAPIALEDHAIRACLAALESRRNPNAWRTGSNAVTVSHCNCESASIRVRWSPARSVAAVWVTPPSVNRWGWRSGWNPSRRRVE
jgi:hypothetical protein